MDHNTTPRQHLPKQVGKDTRFTLSQWQAIHQDGDNILVSASAGSGKTTVLTRRIIEKIKKGVRVDQLIVVTFTEAATREMKQRIQQAIEQAIEDDDNNNIRPFLEEQLTLLPQAQISTIHGFCVKLIREHFQSVHIDPNFKLLTDSTEIALMKEDVLHELKEKLYDNADFQTLVKSYSDKNTDDKLADLIFKLYEFSRPKANSKEWLLQLAELYDVSDLAHSRLYQELILPTALQTAKECVVLMKRVLDEIADVSETDKSYGVLAKEHDMYQSVYEGLLQKQPYDTIRLALDYDYDTLRFSKEIKEHYNVETLKKWREEAKKLFTKTLKAQLFFASEEKQVMLLQSAGKVVKTLAEVVVQFDDMYTTEKFNHQLLDYNDLEHYALEILAPLQNDGSRQLSDIALFYQNHINEIMIDEYQDVNRLQEMILSSLSNGKNMFMVGDVKQSIYAFRMADPSLFQEKYDRFKKGNGGQRILLQENFRSRQSVLHATNYIFMQLMDKALGQMDYDSDAMLVQGNENAYPDEQNVDLSVLIYEREKSEKNDEDVDKFEGEMTVVMHKIKQLIKDKTPITIGFDDTNQHITKAIEYKDIALLLPTKTNNLHIKRLFEENGIPVTVQEADTYFKRSEIVIMTALLKIIDNPYQDIPLVSVLKSPIGQLGENELAAIRINDRTSDYYTALCRYQQNYELGEMAINAFEQTLYEKVTLFLNRLNNWRQISIKESLVTLIWAIYNDTMFLDYVGGLKNGKQRQANLHALYELAESYEKSHYKGVFQFVRYIEQMRKNDNDIDEPTRQSGDTNAVSVMTIHSSKGLEYPYVFLCDMTKQFNMDDIKGDNVLVEEYGIGTHYFDTTHKWKYPTLAYEGVKQFKRKKILAEEMRKLYVALTRAKEKLYLVGSAENEQMYWENLTTIMSHSDIVLPESVRGKEKGKTFDWVSLALARHCDSQNDYTNTAIIPTALSNISLNISYEFYKSNELNTERVENPVAIDDWLTQRKNTSDCATIKAIEDVALYQYPHIIDTKTTSYQSVSELKRLLEDPDMITLELTNSIKPKHRYVEDKLAVPNFLQQSVISSAQLGTATHFILQQLDFSKNVSLQNLEKTIQNCVGKQLITSAVAEKINRQAILKFLTTSFGQFVQKHHERLQTEVPIAVLMNAQQLFKDSTSQHDILVHGIIDGYIESDDGLVLFDYKTDKLFNGTIDDVVSRYKAQLNIYAKALSVAKQKPVNRAVLCLLEIGENIDVPIE